MAQKNIHPYAQPIALKGKNKTAFLLIHGYTGSPTDFNGLPSFLHQNHDVSVFIPLLPGHGTMVEDLRGLTKDDFLKAAEESLLPLLSSYDRVIIGGHSFGGQLALTLAARHPVSGVFVTALPYKFFFPLSIPGFYKLWRALSLKEFLKKRLSPEQKSARVQSFSYDWMPAYALKLSCEMNAELKKVLPVLRNPFLSIFFKGDPIAHPESGHKMKKIVGSKVNKVVLVDSVGHGVFFTKEAPRIYDEIVEFFHLSKE